MKKLLIAMTIACVAALSQAASVKWGAEWATGTDGAGLDSGTWWLVALDSSDTSGFKVFEDGTYDFGSGSVAQTGSIAGGDSVTSTKSGLTVANNGSLYALVIWDGKDAANGGMWGVSGVEAVTGIVAEPPTDANDIIFSNGSDTYSTILEANKDVFAKTPIVPEPSTYALVGLAAAALALRKRFRR